MIRFQDRLDAGRQLGERLAGYGYASPVVLGIPRGGVVVAYAVSEALGAPLAALVARKVGAPFNREFGVGAVAPGGVVVLDRAVLDATHVSEDELEPIVEAETRETERRVRLYEAAAPLPELKGATAILVDDGLATGVTARAAILSLRSHQPNRVVLAVPVAAPESAQAIRSMADAVVDLMEPHGFEAVGVWYERFDAVPDDEVLRLLQLRRNELSSGTGAAQPV